MSNHRHCPGCPGYQDADHAWEECPGLPPDPEVARLREALTVISSYEKGDTGCCPYGCDCPTIAKQALAALEGKA